MIAFELYEFGDYDFIIIVFAVDDRIFANGAFIFIFWFLRLVGLLGLFRLGRG